MADQNDQPQRGNENNAQQDLDDLTVLADVGNQSLGDARYTAVRSADVNDTQLGNLANVQQGSTGNPQVDNLGGLAGGSRIGLDIAIDAGTQGSVAPPELQSLPVDIRDDAAFVQVNAGGARALNVQALPDLAKPDNEFARHDDAAPGPVDLAPPGGNAGAPTQDAGAPAAPQPAAQDNGNDIQAAVNHAPILTSDEAATIDDDTPVSGKITGIDLDGDTLTYSLVNSAGQHVSSITTEYGTIRIDPATGEYTFTPNDKADTLAKGEFEKENFTVVADDGHGGSAKASIDITINGSNDEATVSGTVTGAVTEDSGAQAGGTLHVADSDTGESQVLASTVHTDQGTFTVGTDGHWSFDLNNADPSVQALGAGEAMTKTFTVTSADGTASQDISVTITGSNDGPVVGSDVHLAGNDGNNSIIIRASDLLSTASDTDTGDALSVTDVSATNGTIVDNLDGTYTFTPTPSYSGEVDLTYTVSDSHGGTTQGSASFDVTATTGGGETGGGETGGGQTGGGETGGGQTGGGETGGGQTGGGETGGGETGGSETGGGETGGGETGGGQTGGGETGGGGQGDNGVGNGADGRTPGHSTSNDEHGAGPGNPEHAHHDGGQDGVTLSTSAHVHVVADPAASVSSTIGADSIHTSTVTTVTGGNGTDFGNDSGTLVIHATADKGNGGDKHGFDIVYDGHVVGHAESGITTITGLDVHDGGKLSFVDANGTNVTVDSVTLNGTNVDVGAGTKSGGVQVDSTHDTADLHNGSVTYTLNDGNAGEVIHTTTTTTHTHTQVFHLDVSGEEGQLGGVHVTGLHAGDTVSDGSHVWTAGGDGSFTITEAQLDGMAAGGAVHHDFTVISGEGTNADIHAAGLAHDGGAYQAPSHLEADLSVTAGGEHAGAGLTFSIDGVPPGCAVVTDAGTLTPGADGSYSVAQADAAGLKVVIPGDGSVSDFDVNISATDSHGHAVEGASQSLSIGVDEAIGSPSHSFDTVGTGGLSGTDVAEHGDHLAPAVDDGSTMLFDFGTGHDTIGGGSNWTDVADHADGHGDHGQDHGDEHKDWTEKADKHAEDQGHGQGHSQEHKDEQPVVHHQAHDEHQNHFQSHDHGPL